MNFSLFSLHKVALQKLGLLLKVKSLRADPYWEGGKNRRVTFSKSRSITFISYIKRITAVAEALKILHFAKYNKSGAFNMINTVGFSSFIRNKKKTKTKQKTVYMFNNYSLSSPSTTLKEIISQTD